MFSLIWVREEGEGERGRNISWWQPDPGTGPATWVYAWPRIEPATFFFCPGQHTTNWETPAKANLEFCYSVLAGIKNMSFPHSHDHWTLFKEPICSSMIKMVAISSSNKWILAQLYWAHKNSLSISFALNLCPCLDTSFENFLKEKLRFSWGRERTSEEAF